MAYRAAIGVALGIVAANDRRANEARGLLKGWANSDNRALRLAAAHAYIYVGARYPEDAIRQWQAIANQEVTKQSPAITNPDAEQIIEAQEENDNIKVPIWWKLDPRHYWLFSTIQIFIRNSAGAAYELRGKIFEALVLGIKEWIDADQKARRSNDAQGLGMSIILEMSYWSVRSNDQDVEPATWAPLLLTLVDPSDPQSSYRAALAKLLYQALLTQPQEMLDILRVWLEHIDDDRRYEPQLLAILQDIVAHEGRGQQGRVWNRLMLRLRDWATHRSAPLPTARRAYNRLRTVQPAV